MDASAPERAAPVRSTISAASERGDLRAALIERLRNLALEALPHRDHGHADDHGEHHPLDGGGAFDATCANRLALLLRHRILPRFVHGSDSPLRYSTQSKNGTRWFDSPTIAMENGNTITITRITYST